MASIPQSRSRHRKVVVLTQSGFQRLQFVQSQSNIWDDYTRTCTLEALSERTGLSTHTLSKVYARKSGVDLRTLVRYFSAFDLTLEVSDYTAAEKMNAQAKSGQLALSQVAIRSPSLGASAVVSWGDGSGCFHLLWSCS